MDLSLPLRPRVLATSGCALLLLCFVLQPLLTASGGAGNIGGPAVGTVAGPVEVFASAEAQAGPVGDVVETTLVVENDAAEPATVFLVGELAWPDGSTTLLRYGPPTEIPANGSVVTIAISPVPAGVGTGAGSFTAVAVVTRIGNGRGGETGALIARDADAFTL